MKDGPQQMFHAAGVTFNYAKKGQARSIWRQWIMARQTLETTMKAIVKRTARGERVVVIEQPSSQRSVISQG